MDYLDFIFRDTPTAPQITGVEGIPNYLEASLYWTIFFSLLQIGTTFFSKVLFPEWYNNLTDRKKIEFPAYFSCLFFHFTVVPIGFHQIYIDYIRSSEEWNNVQYIMEFGSTMPFTIGYLTGDLICYAVPMVFKKHYEMFFHHVVSLLIIFDAFKAAGHFCRFLPHLLICELTNIFFNIPWCLRLTIWKDHFLVSFLEICFVVSFFFIRIVNLPLAIIAIQLKSDVNSLGLSRFLLILILWLQFYWFSIIIQKSYERFYLKIPKDNKGAVADKLPVDKRKE
jgi:hypothetical protein